MIMEFWKENRQSIGMFGLALVFLGRTEQNRNFMQLKLRPRAGGIRIPNKNKQTNSKDSFTSTTYIGNETQEYKFFLSQSPL